MLLTAGAFGYSYSQPLKRDVHAQEGALVQPPTQLCGVGQKRVADLPRGSTEGKQEVLRGDRKYYGETGSAEGKQEVLRGNRKC